VLFPAGRAGWAGEVVSVARAALGGGLLGLHPARYPADDGSVLDLLLRALADWAEYQRFSTMLCTLVIYESAYIAEIVRGGIQALPQGQYEASRALGMSYLKTLRLVILPQALFNALPSLVSQLVSIIKDSTLGYVINVPELTYAANQVSNQLLTKPFQVFAIVALSYYIICFSLTWLANRLESWIANKRLNAQPQQGEEQNDPLFFANRKLNKETS
jgi:polar amino acid transport system permease protein